MHNLPEVLPHLREDERTIMSTDVFNAPRGMAYVERPTKFPAAKGATR
jgi:hypothetical protein